MKLTPLLYYPAILLSLCFTLPTKADDEANTSDPVNQLFGGTSPQQNTTPQQDNSSQDSTE